VCAALELTNPSKTAQGLDDDEKTTLTNSEGQAGHGPQEFLIINESGLWSLVLRSRKPEARRFKRWLTSEVIPALRQTGSYGAPALASGENAALQITAMRDAILPEIGEMIAAAMAAATAKSLTGALEAVLPGMVRQAIDTSSRVLTRDFVTVGQLLDEQQVPSKGRRGLVSLVAKSLRTWCIARGATPRRPAEAAPRT
jgi:prophage antirepressor-like protein